MRIEVVRHPGDRRGPDIVDALLTTEQAGIERGRQEIDRNCSNRMIENGNCPQLDYMATGSLVSVTNARGSYRGKLKSWALTIDIDQEGREFSVATSITIEREM